MRCTITYGSVNRAVFGISSAVRVPVKMRQPRAKINSQSKTVENCQIGKKAEWLWRAVSWADPQGCQISRGYPQSIIGWQPLKHEPADGSDTDLGKPLFSQVTTAI